MKTTLSMGVGVALLAAACHVIPDEPPDMQVLRQSQPIGDAKELAVNVKFDVGSMELGKSMTGDLYAVDLEYDKRRVTPKVDFNGRNLDVDIDTRSIRLGGNHNRHDNNLTLRLTDKVPLDLQIDTGVSEARLNLGGLNIKTLSLEGGVGKTEVTFDAPTTQPMKEMRVESGVGELIIRGLGNSRAERMDFEGGVGRAEIDFTGELGMARVEAGIEVGVGHIKLVVPKEADIEIQTDGSFLSNVSAPSFERQRERKDLNLKQSFTHRSGASDSPKIFIRIQSGIGGVTVDLM